MTLDETIKRTKDLVDAWEADAKTWLECNPIGEPRKRAYEEYVKCKECAEEYRQLAEWLKDYKRLKEQTRWIPVNESLPDEEGLYLVTVKNEHNRRYSKTCWFHGDDNWFARQDVIAWMLLPEPYEAEREG